MKFKEFLALLWLCYDSVEMEENDVRITCDGNQSSA